MDGSFLFPDLFEGHEGSFVEFLLEVFATWSSDRRLSLKVEVRQKKHRDSTQQSPLYFPPQTSSHPQVSEDPSLLVPSEPRILSI